MPESSPDITTFDQIYQPFAAQPGDPPDAHWVRGLAWALADAYLQLDDCPARAEALEFLVLAQNRAVDAAARAERAC